ncbi:uncharacterized protein LOC108001112 [Apis cerana]|uniref:uncharacterized protein LOC108001112 n=1 Tax=Apis cerana TaxID=7461 RepID=UPI00109B87FB|nr:uncharacterized protein LOC108001112 [Apis cerana]
MQIGVQTDRSCCKYGRKDQTTTDWLTGKEGTSRREDAEERSRIADREEEKNVERVNVRDTLKYYLDRFRHLAIDDDETEDAGL